MKKILLSLVFAFTGFVFSANAQVLKSDSLALVALYNSTGGANWVNKWDLHTPVSGWYGVTVSGNRVIHIQIGSDGDNNLVGTLPNSIGNLSALTYVDIGAQPNLTGKIPMSIGNLTQVTALFLASNNLSGNIPSSIGNMINLIYLDMSDNLQLEGSLPSSFKNLVNLTGIYLYDCNLSGTLKILESIPHPFDFEFTNNHLSGPLPKLQNMSGVEELDLGSNEFTGVIPDDYGYMNFTGGGVLDLAGNQLTGKIPQTFGISGKTRQAGLFLILADNKLSGPVPANLVDFFQPNGVPYSDVNLVDNDFDFDSIEYIVANPPFDNFNYQFQYSPQASIPIKINGDKLSVNAGGTLSNNTYKWYKNGTLVSTKVGNAKYKTTGPGKYNVVVTNSVATQLTLYSDTVTISGLVADGKLFTQDQKAILLFPNPAKDLLNISLSASQNEKVQIQIVDVNGRIVFNQNTNIAAGASTQTINVSKLAKGNYFVEIKSEEGNSSLKFVKE